MAAQVTARSLPEPGYDLVVGLGATGLSCARHLVAAGRRVVVCDSREQPPGLERLAAELPAVECFTGPFQPELFLAAGRVLLSPGLDPALPAPVAARQAGIEVIGDIELFAREVDAPVIAVTGSNGKSTVTTLVAEMAAAAGRQVRAGGNLGPPALELLQEEAPDLYVLELSSFQLDLCRSLRPLAAVVLNLSADHLDRYADLEAYAASKRRIYQGAQTAVVNLDDPLVAAMAPEGAEVIGFSLEREEADYHLVEVAGAPWLGRGGTPLLPVAALRLQGRHNLANALAALALARAAGLEEAPCLEALTRYAGLPHRCEPVAEIGGVSWVNDSKGTNVGATAAALAGYRGRSVILLAGGLGKGADFAPLAEAARGVVRQALLFGRDAEVLAQALEPVTAVERVEDLEAAVARAAQLAQPGEGGLLSPADTNQDQFADYQARGEAFRRAVGALLR